MIVLGVDPGVATTGFGVIRFDDDEYTMLDYGCIKTAANEKKEKRLCEIFDGISGLISRHNPDILAIEKLFFNRNTKTALQVGEASGVILLAAGKADIPVAGYTPLQVKECLAGFGRAKKEQVREVVQMELELDFLPKPIDASDALAIALCHYHLEGLEE